MASKLGKLPRGHRYWLKDNSMEFYFPKVSREQYEFRDKMWDPAHLVGHAMCVGVGIYGTLRYLWPNTFKADFPFITFLQFGWMDRAVDRSIKRETKESKEY